MCLLSQDWIGTALHWNTTLHLVNQITPADCPGQKLGYFCATPRQITTTWCTLYLGSPLISLELGEDTSSDQHKLIFRGVLIDKSRYTRCDHTMMFLDSRSFRDEINDIILADNT